MTKLRKTQKVTNSKCDKTEKPKMLPNSKLKMWQNSKTENVRKLKNWKCYKTQKLKIWQNSKTQNATKLKTHSECLVRNRVHKQYSQNLLYYQISSIVFITKSLRNFFEVFFLQIFWFLEFFVLLKTFFLFMSSKSHLLPSLFIALQKQRTILNKMSKLLCKNLEIMKILIFMIGKKNN